MLEPESPVSDRQPSTPDGYDDPAPMQAPVPERGGAAYGIRTMARYPGAEYAPMVAGSFLDGAGDQLDTPYVTNPGIVDMEPGGGGMRPARPAKVTETGPAPAHRANVMAETTGEDSGRIQDFAAETDSGR